MNEEWRTAVTKYGPQSNLMASNLGRIKRLPYKSGKSDTCQDERIYESKGQKYGHIIISWADPQATTTNGRRPILRDFAHRIIALTFIGTPTNDSAIIRHKNGNARDNRPENLVWGSRGQNSLDRISEPNSISTHPIGLFVGPSLKKRIDHAINNQENERAVLIEVQSLINKFIG